MTLSPEQQQEVDALLAEMDELQKDAAKLDIKREEKVEKKRKLGKNEKLFPPPTPEEEGTIRIKYVSEPSESIDYPLPNEGNNEIMTSLFVVLDPTKITDSEQLIKEGNIVINPVQSNVAIYEVHPNDPKPHQKKGK